eukprot:c23581_g1_i1 orf=163-336(-)
MMLLLMCLCESNNVGSGSYLVLWWMYRLYDESTLALLWQQSMCAFTSALSFYLLILC